MLRAVIRRASTRGGSSASSVSFLLFSDSSMFCDLIFPIDLSLSQGLGKSLQSSRVAASSQSFHSLSATQVTFLLDPVAYLYIQIICLFIYICYIISLDYLCYMLTHNTLFHE